MERWKEARSYLVVELLSGRVKPRAAWRPLERVAAMYQLAKSVKFLVLPPLKKRAMVEWLVALE